MGARPCCWIIAVSPGTGVFEGWCTAVGPGTGDRSGVGADVTVWFSSMGRIVRVPVDSEKKPTYPRVENHTRPRASIPIVRTISEVPIPSNLLICRRTFPSLQR